MDEKNLIMNPERLKKMRPDLYPTFIEILKKEAPGYYKLIVNSPEMDKVVKMFDTKMTIEVSDLPQNAQDLVYQAMKEATERNNKNEQK